MGHYKSNLRDIEFNLFEVFGRQKVLGTGPFAEIDADTARSILDEVERLATDELADSLLDADRNPPVFDPATSTVTHAGVVQEVATRPTWTPSGGGWTCPSELGGTVAPPSLRWAVAELVLGANPAVHMYASGPASRTSLLPRSAPRSRSKVAELMVEQQLGRHDGAHRARRRLRRRRRPHQGRPAGRRHLAHRGRQALHHLGRARHGREHRPPRAGPPRGRTARAPRACRCSSSRSSTSTGRPASSASATASTSPTSSTRWASRSRPPASSPSASSEPGRRLAGRRGARRHRADVQGHRVRPDDGRHQGDRHAVDRLPQRARLRQEPRAGRRPDADDRQDRAAGHDHPPPRRAPLADAAEGVRRGHARARPLHRHHPGRRSRSPRPRATTATTSPIRLNDLLLPIVKGFGSEKSYELLAAVAADLRRLGYLQDYPIEQYIRDAKIDTLYEGTTAIQGMDLFFRKIVRDQGQALTKLVDRRSRSSPRATRATARCRRSATLLAQGARGRAGHRRHDGRRADRRPPRTPTNIYKVGQNTTRLLHGLPATWSSAGCCCARPRSPWRRSDAGATGRDKAVLRGQGRRGAVLRRARCCRCSPRTARSPRPSTTRSWTCPRTPSSRSRVELAGRDSTVSGVRCALRSERPRRADRVAAGCCAVGRGTADLQAATAACTGRPAPSTVSQREVLHGHRGQHLPDRRRRDPGFRRQLRRLRPGHRRRRLHPHDRRRSSA